MDREAMLVALGLFGWFTAINFAAAYFDLRAKLHAAWSREDKYRSTVLQYRMLLDTASRVYGKN